MRTSRLRRWMLRGALMSAATMIPLAAANPAQADWTWQDLPPQSIQEAGQLEDSDLARETVEQPSADEEILLESLGDWTWQ